MDGLYAITAFLYCLFHLVALLLSVVYWKRCPKACALVLVGAVLNLLVSGVRFTLPVIFQLFQEHMGFGLFNLGISCVNLFGSSLYLTAIFTGRRPDRSRLDADDDDDYWDRPASSPRDREHDS
jgi:hypothetical protein